MSRIGLTPISVPENVTVSVQGSQVSVKGPKGELSHRLHHLVKLEQTDSELKVTRKANSKLAKSVHGTTQRILQNLITGVTQGYQKDLELVGTGYRVAKQGNKITLSLGFSHPVEFQSPEGIELKIEGNNKISVLGIDKQQVGHVAATIRGFRPPEPYKGKGIRYSDEVVRRKAGKAAKTAA